MPNKEYRIIYFNDNRYGGIERYLIVEGKYTQAITVQNWLMVSGFAENVSRYYTLESQYVMPFGKEPKLKPSYKDMATQKFWL